jgi:CheY-like chemotaxis protein
MSRIVLIHWNPDAVEERAERLRRAGHEVIVPAEQNSPGLRAVRDDPPDAFLVDLDRRPSHGREVAQWLRQSPRTRPVPIVFAGGDREKTARVRATFPDATFAEWSAVRGALRRAMGRPPADPVVPAAAAFYGDTPLPRKLGVKPGCTVALLGAPRGFETVLGELPEGVRVTRRSGAPVEIALFFARTAADLRKRLPAARRAIASGGALWILWPKKASGVTTDLTQAIVRATGLKSGLVDYKIAAIDATWSGLRFARRRPVRTSRSPSS